MNCRPLLAFIACLAFGIPTAAQAQQQQMAYAASSAYLRAGPGKSYPLVAHMISGDVVKVLGCVRSNEWCDIDAKGHRGWVQGKTLEAARNGRRLNVAANAERVNLPEIAFDQRSYWDTNYKHYPFFTERRFWAFWPKAETPAEVRAYRYADVGE